MSGFSVPLRKWPALLRLRHAILRAQRSQDLDADSPPLVVLTDSSTQLLLHAQMLAAEDREDREAVSELVRLANGDQQALRIAALAARQDGEHHDSTAANLTHRLLQGAIVADRLVAPLPDGERAQLALLDDFAELTVSAQWHRLTELQPRLVDLTGHLSTDQLARHLRPIEIVELPPAQRAPILTARQEARERIRAELAPLLGPESATDHPILRSQIAVDAALMYLMEIDGRE